MESLFNEITQLTSKKLLDAESILEITNEMTVHIQMQDMDSLNRAIDERQKRINQTISVNVTAKVKEKELLNQLSANSMEDIDKEAYPQVIGILNNKERAKRTYSRAYKTENTNCEGAEDLLKSYKDAIRDLHTNKKALQAYSYNPPGQSIMINKIK